MENIFEMPIFIKYFLWGIFIISGTTLFVMYFLPQKKRPHQNILLSNIAGVVIVNYLPNKNGDIDKVVYTLNRETYTAHFPPHTAKAIMAIAHKDDTVNFEFEPKPHGPNKERFNEILLVEKGDQLLRLNNIKPPPPLPGKLITIEPDEFEFILDSTRSITGIRTNKYIIPLPPNLVITHTGDTKSITIKGYERQAGEGFVNLDSLIMLKAYSITINNTEYLL